jgi:hypothetical protein
MPITVSPNVSSHAPSSHRPALVRWIVAVTIGEALGFAVAAVVAVIAASLSLPDPWRYVVLVGAGAVEGAALGASQLVGMSAHRPHARAWIGATALGAAVAWSIGMLPSTLALSLDTAPGIVMLVVGAIVLLASIPVAQWLVIRQRAHSSRWIPVNMGAWTVAILWTFAPSPLVDESTSLAVLIAVYAVAGLLMAATVAALTAATATRLFSGPKIEQMKEMQRR